MAQFLIQIISSLFWTFLSIAWAELIRDLWHFACHKIPFLYRVFHRWHHIAYTESLEKRSAAVWRKAEWRHGVPEASLRLLGSLLFWYLTQQTDIESWCITASFAGVLFSLRHLFFVVLRGLGLVKTVDPLHQCRPFEAPPSQWKLNLAYHYKHHSVYLKAYYGAIYTILDQVLGTALSLHHMQVAMMGFPADWTQVLEQDLEKAGARVTTDIANIGLRNVDILIIANGDPSLIRTFFNTVQTNRDIACKELWWVSFPGCPALPNWVCQSAPCIVRQISVFAAPDVRPELISHQILFQAKRHVLNILVTRDPLLVLLYRLKLLLNKLWDGYVSQWHRYPSAQQERESC